ncbi:MAG: BamA/TamA family outer membrane protein [Flavobacterium sp.]|nr:BamA/TamA family outer membrane protein [Flavobacterium sp.]
MSNSTAKISLFILIGIIITACNTLKRVPSDKNLLTKNEVFVNEKKINAENITDLIYQKPNSSILGYKLRLNLYNLASLKHDSLYQARFTKNPEKYKRMSKLLSAKQVNRLGKSFWYSGIHEFLKKTGEAPVIPEDKSTVKSNLRLKSHYFNQGYFDVKSTFEVDSISPRKVKIKYNLNTGNPYTIDSIRTTILTPALDSLYQDNRAATFLKSGKQYKTVDFEAERSRITTHFRNNGAYDFQPTFINFDIDTLNGNHKANINLKIENFSYSQADSIKTKPFNLYPISEVNIYTDHNPKDTSKVAEKKTSFSNFNLFSKGKLKYKPKAITNAIFVTKGSLYSDSKTNLSTRYLSNLRVFNYPTIKYRVDPNDSIHKSLIADIYLTQREKYSFGYGIDFTHSNIQDFGISGNLSFLIRNVFNGAETFEIVTRGNIGSSRDLANPNNQFFNVSDYGVDLKLNFPRIFMFFNADKIIPKRMLPSTSVTMGFSKQQNIGLDKENFTGAMTYNWTHNRSTSLRFDLFNIQYVKNLNPDNYFNIYKSSYDLINDLAKQYNANPSYFDESNNLIVNTGIEGFLGDVANNVITLNTDDLKSVRSVAERAIRLTENNLIFASSFSVSKSTKKDINDESFHIFRSKIESAGNFLSLLANISKQTGSQDASKTIFEVAYSQYYKTELEYIKHWDLKKKKVLAFRSFVGIAVPYGNSESVPFSRSYFSGGSNDNRAWQSYSLGPGRTSARRDFNEANFKIAVSAEFRFNFFSKFNGALFIDTGNIWNVFDNIEAEEAVFTGIESLQDTAVGSGFGLRYDLSFFVLRLDFGFKTFNPSDTSNKKWFRDYNFGNSVVNIGINYPF